jgi:hypothetical protein
MKLGFGWGMLRGPASKGAVRRQLSGGLSLDLIHGRPVFF